MPMLNRAAIPALLLLAAVAAGQRPGGGGGMSRPGESGENRGGVGGRMPPTGENRGDKAEKAANRIGALRNPAPSSSDRRPTGEPGKTGKQGGKTGKQGKTGKPGRAGSGSGPSSWERRPTGEPRGTRPAEAEAEQDAANRNELAASKPRKSGKAGVESRPTPSQPGPGAAGGHELVVDGDAAPAAAAAAAGSKPGVSRVAGGPGGPGGPGGSGASVGIGAGVVAAAVLVAAAAVAARAKKQRSAAALPITVADAVANPAAAKHREALGHENPVYVQVAPAYTPLQAQV